MNVDPRALDATIVNKGEELTLRNYFQKLLLTLWQDPYGFSGKRPLTSSGWKIDVAAALVRGGFIEGSFDEDGFIKEYNDELADAYVCELIQNHLFRNS